MDTDRTFISELRNVQQIKENFLKIVIEMNFNCFYKKTQTNLKIGSIQSDNECGE